jgi:hypothetical protein
MKNAVRKNIQQHLQFWKLAMIGLVLVHFIPLWW